MIDWPWIASLEGGSLTATVPDPEHSQSGATFQGGIDVANLGPEVWNAMPESLRLKIMPYRWWKGMAAERYLELHPITISQNEQSILQEIVSGDTLSLLSANYLRDAKAAFSSLPDACQTVMASVSYQYGNLSVRTPNFWRACCEKDWVLCYKDLMHFSDRYPTRRQKEAAYLKEHLGLEGV